MKSKNPLDKIYFINLPENFKFPHTIIKIDPSIPLPVQKKDETSPGAFNMEELDAEQVLSGILTVLAYDRHNKNLNYYRSIINQAYPEIKKELTESAIIETKNEEWDEAEELFLILRALSPDDPAVTLNAALFFDQRAESYRKLRLHEDADAYDHDALLYYKEAMNAEPPVPEAFFNCGFFYLKQYNYIEAKNCFETYSALICDADDKELGENGLYKKERAQEILNYITNSNMDDAKFQRAYQLISSGQEEKGLEEIKKYIQLNPNVWNAWFLLGWGLRRLECWNAAEQAFLKAIEEGGEENSDVHNELAICFLEQNKLDKAQESLTKALHFSPEDTKIISNLGFLALKKGDKAQAADFFKTVLVFNPNDKIAEAELEKLKK